MKKPKPKARAGTKYQKLTKPTSKQMKVLKQMGVKQELRNFLSKQEATLFIKSKVSK